MAVGLGYAIQSRKTLNRGDCRTTDRRDRLVCRPLCHKLLWLAPDPFGRLLLELTAIGHDALPPPHPDDRLSNLAAAVVARLGQVSGMEGRAG